MARRYNSWPRCCVEELSKQSSKVAHTDEEVFVQGTLRAPQVRSAFTPDSHPEKGGWYWIDVDVIAGTLREGRHMFGLSFLKKHSVRVPLGVRLLPIDPRTEDYTEEAAIGSKKGTPIGKYPVVGMRNPLVTW